MFDQDDAPVDWDSPFWQSDFSMDDDRTKLFDSLDSVQRRILQLAMQDVSTEVIANTVKRSPRTVRREIRRFEEQLERRRIESA